MTKINKHYTMQEYMETFSSIQDMYDYYFEMQQEIDKLSEYNMHLIKEIKDYEELLLEKQNIINLTREMLYKRELDDYDTYTANVICDIQSDFEEIFRGEY